MAEKRPSTILDGLVMSGECFDSDRKEEWVDV